ncbi:MAG: type II toxin-antitoxin system RelE/ParE family toxin [Gammaproteobacteria bacterium]
MLGHAPNISKLLLITKNNKLDWAHFTIEIENAIQRIVEAPHRWQLVGDKIRRCLTNTFPYCVLYSIKKDHVLVLAIMHHSRKPSYWHSRSR